MQQFSFPILERKEILSYVLVDAGIALEEQNLVKPTCEVIWPVYENLALNIMGKTRCASPFPPHSTSYLRKENQDICLCDD